MSADNAVGLLGSTQSTVIQNVGAKRILGSNLVAIGKMPNWVYYLVDIDSICVYANQGSDVWIGAFGHPIAGSIAIRDSLTPFEGQKFYVIETDVSYTWQGGAWTGGAIRANVIAPSWLILDAAVTLTRGRNHVGTVSGDYVLPSNLSTTKGDTLEGHSLTLFMNRGTNGTINSAEGDTFSNNVTNEATSMDATGGNMYTAIFVKGQWKLSYIELGNILQSSNNLADLADKGVARTNLEVYSKLNVDALMENKLDANASVVAGTGIQTTGTLSEGLTVSVDFASNAEAVDVNNTTKALYPKHLPVAISNATRSSQYNNITGLLPKTTESKFLMTANADRTKVDYPSFTVVFNPDPYLRTQELQSVTYPAGSINLPTTLGTVTHRVIASSAGAVLLENTIPDVASINKTFLGSIVTSDGEVGSTPAFGDQIYNVPWLASSESSLRNSSTTFTGGTIAPTLTAGTLKRGVASVERESVNWEQSTIDPHRATLGAVDPITFTYLNEDGTVYGDIGTTFVDGRVESGGDAVTSNKVSIQVAYITTEGLIVVLLGQSTYPNMSDALAQIESYLPVQPAILNGTVEFSRWAVKGSQYEGSGDLDLFDVSKFVATAGSQINGGTSGGSASDIVSSTTNNDLTSTNLQEQVNELAGRTLKEWQIQQGVFAIDVNSRTLIEQSLEVASNYDFSLGGSSWSKGSDVDVVYLNGTALVNTLVLSINSALYQVVSVAAGKKYKLTLAIRSPTDGGTVVRVYAKRETAPYSNYSDAYVNLTSEWQELTYEFTATADEPIRLYMALSTSSGAAVEVTDLFEVDYVRLRETSEITLPATIEAKDECVLASSPDALDNSKLLNPLYTIVGAGDTVLPTESLILEPGNTLHMIAVNNSTFKVV